jgi:hypothetical protein
MSECGVCLYSDASDCEGMIDGTSIVSLEKDQTCSECNKVVSAGAQIEEAIWNYDERKKPIYTCLICAEIANAFYCGGDGRMYGGGLWEDMDEVMDDLNSACFDRLSTPEAKTYLRERWMKWKGLP